MIIFRWIDSGGQGHTENPLQQTEESYTPNSVDTQEKKWSSKSGVSTASVNIVQRAQSHGDFWSH